MSDRTTAPAASADRAIVPIAAVAAAFLLVAGIPGLTEPTETRYAEIAREMRANGDWLRPYLDGIPHFHKPPFAYWAAALGMSVAGENEWGARIPAALAGLVTVACAVRATRRLGGSAASGALAAWTLASSFLFFLLGRAVGADVYLTAAVAAFWAFAPSTWAIVALGVGFLIKGPVVLLHTALPVLIVAALRRERAALRRLGPARAWWLAAAIALPWYLWIVTQTPGLFSYLIGNQIWQRVATTEHSRGGPMWYFVPVLLVGLLPWTPALVAGIRALWRERMREESALLLVWLIAPFVFLSFSGSKLPGYLLPVFPAGAIACAIGLERGGRGTRWAVAIGLVVLAAAASVAAWMLWVRWIGVTEPGRLVLPPPLAWIGLALLAAAAVPAARSAHRVSAALVLAGLTALLLVAAPFDGPLGSPRGIARVLAENRRGEPVVEIGRFNAGLPFYLREQVPLLEIQRETQFDLPGLEARVFVTRDSLASLADRYGRVWVLGPEPHARDIAADKGLEYRVVRAERRSSLGFLTR